MELFKKEFVISLSLNRFLAVEPKCELFEGSSQMTVTAGAFKELRCVLKSGNYSNAEWIWLKNGNIINETSSQRYKFSRVNHESILAITDVEVADQAVYTCLLKNDYGNSTQTFEFQVNGKEIIRDDYSIT